MVSMTLTHQAFSWLLTSDTSQEVWSPLSPDSCETLVSGHVTAFAVTSRGIRQHLGLSLTFLSPPPSVCLCSRPCCLSHPRAIAHKVPSTYPCDPAMQVDHSHSNYSPVLVLERVLASLVAKECHAPCDFARTPRGLSLFIFSNSPIFKCTFLCYLT